MNGYRRHVEWFVYVQGACVWSHQLRLPGWLRHPRRLGQVHSTSSKCCGDRHVLIALLLCCAGWCVQMSPYQKRQAELERRRELLREA